MLESLDRDSLLDLQRVVKSRLLKAYINHRIEHYRSILEREESHDARGGIKELRNLLRLDAIIESLAEQRKKVKKDS